MDLDVALGANSLLNSLGGFSPSVHPMLRVLDQFSSGAPLGRGFCCQRSSIRCRLLPASRLDPKWSEPGPRGIAPVSWREKLHRVAHDVRTRSVFLTPASTRVIVCQCRRGGENSGRFEDCEMGSFADPSLNCEGDKNCAGNGSGRSSMDFDARDFLRSRPWNGTGDGLCFVHDHSDSDKELRWASSYWPATSSTPAWDGRVMNCSGFNAIGQILLRHKASTAGTPMSLRMLKRKQVQNRALREENLQQTPDDACESHRCLAMAGGSTYCSFKKAFASMVFMIRTLQSHTIQLRKGVFYEDLQDVLAVVHRELNSSFLLLFQQVFACTPKLMLAVMLLLANYTVYSMGNHVALGAVQPPPPPPAELASFDMNLIGGLLTDASQDSAKMSVGSAVAVSAQVEAWNHESRDSWPSTQTEVSGAGGTSGSIVSISACSFGPFESGGHASRNRDLNAEGEPDEAEVVDSQAKELAPEFLILHHELKKSMVAPVLTKLAPDDYSCYDRTELIYQHAIDSDSTNALLLVNYAQFLYVVRRDHDRAEQLFTRAIKADPTDGHIISRFASFLWLARGDRLAAEKAYRAVVDLDPSNPYFTGCLANFMWHAGERAPCNITQQSDRMKGVTDEDFC